jgi:hypothetical protein
MPHLTKFEFFEQGYAQLAMELGLITPSEFMRFIHFKEYLQLREDGYKKKDAIFIIAEKCRCSESTVWRSVAFFTS